MALSSFRSTLSREELKITDDILRMGSMFESALDRAIVALKQRDSRLAQQIIDDDLQINRLRYKIETDCLALMATQQPTGLDVRKLVAATHVAVELERMADYAAGIAQITLRMFDQPLLKPLIDLPLMANVVKEMTHAGLDAYVHNDVALARRIITRDAEVNQLYQQIFRELLTYMLEDPKDIGRATFLLWVAHNLERIGDRATNLCERTIFVSTGQMGDLNADELLASG